MVTNINLSSAEETEKNSVSGKTMLLLSIILVGASVAALLLIMSTKQYYASQQRKTETEIKSMRDKIQSSTYADIFDFQERLNLLEKAIDDHPYWDNFMKETSTYVIPEVRLETFSAKKTNDGGTVDISGVAKDYESLSKELILLKSFSKVSSFEFKNASQNQGQGEGQSGVSFNLSLKLDKTAFQK